jgi:flagellin-like protein
MNNKKGISPLIATLLLVAFAVALGAMIINIGSGIINTGPSCDTLKVTLVNQDTLCYDVTTATTNAEFDYDQQGVREIIFKENTRINGNVYDINFIPQIIKNNKLESCLAAKLTVSNVHSC